MAGTWNSWRRKNVKRRFYKRKGFWIGFFGFGILVTVAGWIFWNSYSTPYRDRSMTYDLERINDIEVPSIILDRNGKEIGRIFVENRSMMAFQDIPSNFINALKAGEDSRFDSHDGVDYIGVARAGLKIIRNRGEVTQGASTITQQLARDAFSLKAEAKKRQESGFQRKMVEMFLAQRIERRYRKDEILGFFVNRTFLGSGYYGLRSASLGYFGKEPKDLTIPECASIVTILRNPLELSPINNLEANRSGRNHVIWRMREEGMISNEDMARFQALPVTLHPKPLQRGTTHVYELIAAEARLLIGEDAFAKGGFTIRTTICKESQDAAQKTMAETFAAVEARPDYANPKYKDFKKGNLPPAYLQGALMMMDHETGEVLAYVGGRDYTHSQYNFIEEGKKPLGTAFFPFLIAAGFVNGQTPASLVEDEPMDNRMIMVGGREGILGEWGAENQRPTFEGQIPPRKALEKSKIAAMLRFGTQTGLDKVAESTKRFGFEIPDGEKLPRMLVGFESVSMLQAVSAIASFARGGQTGARKAYYVERIEDGTGHAIMQRVGQEPSRLQAIDEASAYQVHSMLQGTMSQGNLRNAMGGMNPTFHGGLKTGTMHDFSGCWGLGYSPRISCGVWCGFLQGDNRPIYDGAFGKDIALPIWKAAMSALPDEYLRGDVHRPATVIEVDVCRVSGQRASQYCYETVEDPLTGLPKLRDARTKEFFRTGTERVPTCAIHSGGMPDVNSGKNTSQDVASLDAIPVRPKEPILIGKDPYQSEISSGGKAEDDEAEEGAFFRSMENGVDTLDLGDAKAQLPLGKPTKLEIEVE
jgi:membrane carboxypeptidase/penicillin-binding protein